MDDYLGPVPRFDYKEFVAMFRVTRGRFQTIMEDFAEDPFFKPTFDCFNNPVASLECKLLHALKTLAFGVAHHAFRDYFQLSTTMARECVRQFCIKMKERYQKEYLRLPTAEDIKAINNLHKSVHGVPGLFGSLDCMHCYWKNCPVAWQGHYKKGGKLAKPSLVLEAVSDYNLWFWHTSFGYAGSLNDINILNLSPFLESLKDGSFKRVEETSEAVPFELDGEQFDRLYILTDGIYPNYARFVKGISQPIYHSERVYTAWQEAARKDIERAFGNLQSKFQVMAIPMRFHSLSDCADVTSCCLILHNMTVSDRVMGDPRAKYKPDYGTAEVEQDPMLPQDQQQDIRMRIGLTKGSDIAQAFMARRQEWIEVTDEYEHTRLYQALTRVKVQQHQQHVVME
jgi:hypothetical protein